MGSTLNGHNGKALYSYCSQKKYSVMMTNILNLPVLSEVSRQHGRNDKAGTLNVVFVYFKEVKG